MYDLAVFLHLISSALLDLIADASVDEEAQYLAAAVLFKNCDVARIARDTREKAQRIHFSRRRNWSITGMKPFDTAAKKTLTNVLQNIARPRAAVLLGAYSRKSSNEIIPNRLLNQT